MRFWTCGRHNSEVMAEVVLGPNDVTTEVGTGPNFTEQIRRYASRSRQRKDLVDRNAQQECGDD